MRDYELMTIHRPDLAESDIETKIGELEAYLSGHAAQVTKRDIWGKTISARATTRWSRSKPKPTP
jgi:ribosomal protein S6